MKPFEKAGLIVAFALCLIGVARNADAQIPCAKIADNKAHVCWTPPTQNTDGSPIVLAITYTVQVQSGSTWTNTATNITATDWTSGVLSPGTYNYRVIATVGGVSSDPATGAPAKVVPNPTPTPPSGVVIAQVSVTISSPAFRIMGRYPNAYAGEFVALVPVGRDCSGPILFRKHGYSFRQVIVLPSEGWQDAGPAPKTAAAPCVRIAG